MPIAELFLGALLPVLFERLASRELLNFARREGIDTQLKKWEKMLKSIKEVLNDAEDKQLTGCHEVKSWLEDLENLAYDIEDLLEEFTTTESTKSKSKAEPGTSKAHSLLPSCCFTMSPRALMFNHKMRSEMVEMDARLGEIIARKNGLDLRKDKGKRLAYRQLDKPIPTTNLREHCFVSREDEKGEILKLLAREEDDRTCADLEVIAIVGMGGIGKTTLAQQVYNDVGETHYFDVKVWVCVSDDFDVHAITKCILQKTNSTLSCKDKDLDWCQEKLKETLSGKKFLFILDDVWNENYGEWIVLLKPFESGVKGNKIIVTTRNRNVALMADARLITLKLLSLDDCMTLFASHAFRVRNSNHHPRFEALGLQIVEKCKGLPLAVKTVAGLLRTKVNPCEWEDILNSKIWDLSEGRNDILPALKLSYLHLPSHLRRCFAYCAIFPKDYEIKHDELIHWWSAEGLLEGNGGKNRWNVGLNYFNELESRSLFQKSSSDGSRFLMHDLVNDLAKLVAGATHYSPGEFEFEGDQNNASLVRHASFIPSLHIVPERFKIYHQMKRLRSFISLGKHSGPWGRSYLSQKVLCDLLSKLKYLRVLSLSHYSIGEVPDCIGDLRHLRHLNLSYTAIARLPKSTVGLYNLETLMLRGCQSLIELPEDMEKLINIRFLDITDTSRLRAVPLYIANLVGLEMLSKFIVGTETELRLKELKKLKNLREELCIFDLHKVQDVGDAKDVDLLTKEGICRLTLQWSKDFENSRNEELEAKVLDFLQPHQNVENLVISYYGGIEFTSWLGNPSHVHIVHLHLHECRRAKALPSLGRLSLLKELHIKGLDAIGRIDFEFYGAESPFPSLTTLEFRNMPLWEDWSHCVGSEEGVVFPNLEHLVLRDCPMLIKRLPSKLSSLIKLEINSCPRMDASHSDIISLPSLNELEFEGCNEGVLKSLVDLTSLTTLVIKDTVELTCLNREFTSFLIKLEILDMRNCNELMFLWEDRDVVEKLSCLKKLAVRSCPEFMSFVAGEGDIKLPSRLETVCLQRCNNLEKLPSEMHTLSSLRRLIIDACPKLVSFLETGILTSVRSLNISGCDTSQSLPTGLSIHPEGSSSSINHHVDMTSCLQELIIYRCESLLASPFSEGRLLPATLKRLEIRECSGVKSLAEIILDGHQSLQEIQIESCKNLRSLPQGLHTLSHLTSLELLNCPALECFPPLPANISTFYLQSCWNIKPLPNQLNQLTCLHDLSCDVMNFPDGGLPPQLRELRVRIRGNMKQPVEEWLTPLTSLQELWIIGTAGGVGKEEDLALPPIPSLHHLLIDNMENLERLSSNLPSSLQSLRIQCCPKLRELPLDGLPPSLEILSIYACEILEERCKKGTRYYWHLIREIPEIMLNSGRTTLCDWGSNIT